MSLRSVFVVLLLWGGVTVLPTQGQDVLFDNRPDQMTDWNQFRPQMQTRMGKIRVGEIPETLDYSRSRITPDDFKLGRFNTFLGLDVDSPTARLGNYTKPEPLLPTDYLSEKPEKKERPSANVPIERPATASQSTPLRRQPDFFSQPGQMSETTEDTVRAPAEQRWFRDIGRQGGLPGMSGRSRNPLPGGGMGAGEAMIVGSEPVSATPSQPEPAPGLRSAPDGTRQPTAQDRQLAAAEQARQRRQFEQKLEEMLLSTPKVQFLSPVQISFQNGVATVRGIVPDQQNKVAAGNILLADPAVKQVNNLISTVPTDPGNLPTPVEPK